jgi:lipid A 3-O-deacylase
MKRGVGYIVVAIALGFVRGARAGDGDLRTPDLDMDLNRQPESLAARPTHAPFGQAHSRWWTVSCGVANNLQDATDFNLCGAYSYFLVKDVEFAAELNGWYFYQSGPEALGINPAMVFRWHFYNDGKWTAYADAGIGLLLATDTVPEGGTAFDFTPRIGGGFTRELDPDTGTRLQVGARWHHVSNARIHGASNNPSRDGLMLYAGIQFPF